MLVRYIVRSADEAPKLFYKDKVMEIDPQFDLEPMEIVRMVTEEMFPDLEDSKKNDINGKPFNPNSTVTVALEEYEQWCNPWKFSLIVRLMGRHVGFRMMRGDNQVSNLVTQEIHMNSGDPSPQATNLAQHNSDDQVIFGPWMLVKKTPRRNTKVNTKNLDGSVVKIQEDQVNHPSNYGTCFDILFTYNDQDCEVELENIQHSSVQAPKAHKGNHVGPNNIKAPSPRPVKAQPLNQKANQGNLKRT
ncbi:hypothetical protein SESBI_37313 [Sesbania bispinosa]|nr:hypothetical protein SESBI_37313 [Sesbania bispinosa]